MSVNQHKPGQNRLFSSGPVMPRHESALGRAKVLDCQGGGFEAPLRRISMKAIISRDEALQILKNDLRKAAQEKRAAELAAATAEERQKIMQEIDREIKKELKRRMTWIEPDSLIH